MLHTYSVFISNIGADEKCQVSSSTEHQHHHSDNDSRVMERTCSTSEEEHCLINLNATDVVENGDVSRAVELHGERSGSLDLEGGLGRRKGNSREERRERETPSAGRGREAVKPGWRGKVKRGIKTALVDLKLFLW